MAIIYSGFQDGSRRTPGQMEEARFRERNLYNVANQLGQAALQQTAIDNYLDRLDNREMFKDLPEKKGAFATLLSREVPQEVIDAANAEARAEEAYRKRLAAEFGTLADPTGAQFLRRRSEFGTTYDPSPMLSSIRSTMSDPFSDTARLKEGKQDVFDSWRQMTEAYR